MGLTFVARCAGSHEASRAIACEERGHGDEHDRVERTGSEEQRAQRTAKHQRANEADGETESDQTKAAWIGPGTMGV